MSEEATPKKRGGRVKGVPNKITRDVREMISKVAERCAPKFEGWLDRVAEDDPGKAADLYLKAIEYHIPKLSRSELTGKDGKDLLPPALNVYPVQPDAASK